MRAASSSAPQPVRRITPAIVAGKIAHKMPLAQSQIGQKQQAGNVPAKTYSISPQSRTAGGNKPAILRPPPRILNSSLCRPTNKPTVPSLVTKLVTKDDYEHDTNKQRNNNILQSRSKENNVTSYTYTEKDGKMVPKKVVSAGGQQQPQQQKVLQQRKPALPVVRTQPRQQKIISEPVSMSRYVRKITCFETWYVIRTAELKPRPERSLLALNLMQLGNEVKKIELPSSEWTYKVLLQPLTKQMMAVRDAKCAIKHKNKSIAAVPEQRSIEATADESSADEKPAAAEGTSADAAADGEPKSADEGADAEDSATDKKSPAKKADAKAESDGKAVETEAGKPGDGNEDADKADKTEKKDNKRAKRILRSTRSQKAEAERSADETEKDEEKKDAEAADVQDKGDDKGADGADTEPGADDKPNADIKGEQSCDENADSNGPQEDAQQAAEACKTERASKADVKNESIKAEEEPSDSTDSHEFYTGEVDDPHISVDERHNYRPVNIMFRRKCQTPAIRIQFDRTVILKNQTFYLNVDGKNVRLIGAPQSVETYTDLEVLLQIVNDVDLRNCCVESSTAIA